MDPVIFGIFQVVVLIASVVVHEVSHAAMALYLGDRTAKDLGRITLNPIKHLDMWGSILIPGLLLVTGAPVLFGWAKPVPFNPYNLRNQRWGASMVAAAGPIANLIIAGGFAILLRLVIGIQDFAVLVPMFALIIMMNIFLAIFNLVPIPPLDGSKIFFDLLGPNQQQFKQMLEQYGFFILIIFIMWFSDIIYPIVFNIFTFLVGPGILG